MVRVAGLILVCFPRFEFGAFSLLYVLGFADWFSGFRVWRVCGMLISLGFCSYVGLV